MGYYITKTSLDQQSMLMKGRNDRHVIMSTVTTSWVTI